MLKNDFDRARYDDSIQMIVLKLIFVRRMKRGQHTIAATRTHVATTLNTLETTESARTRKAGRDAPMESISPFTELASASYLLQDSTIRLTIRQTSVGFFFVNFP